MNAKKRILIVDDHPVYRTGLKTLLADNRSFEVVGEAGSYAEGLAMAKRFKPDLALLDISLIDGSGVELARAIRAMLPDLGVIMLSMHSEIEFIAAAFQAGASGYVAKESGIDHIMHAIEAVAAGRQHLDSALSPKVVRRLGDLDRRKAKCIDESYGSLTLREQQVMRLLAEGLSPQEIADKLFVTLKTVINHRYSIMKKLGIKSPLAFVRHAAKLGLVDLDDAPD
ncbi:MAG: response regulator transcription factor [Proteobacteria bacterium]|nr:response regulator transcription factor [Pseudomonadota bacterium]MBU1610642.1 response regulator transcription factor [Pseudomonadota bacterium]